MTDLTTGSSREDARQGGGHSATEGARRTAPKQDQGITGMERKPDSGGVATLPKATHVTPGANERRWALSQAPVWPLGHARKNCLCTFLVSRSCCRCLWQRTSRQAGTHVTLGANVQGSMLVPGGQVLTLAKNVYGGRKPPPALKQRGKRG